MRYIVIGYGESDYPQGTFAHAREELLDAVLGMIYTDPKDAEVDFREQYRADLEDPDEWSEGIWRTEFEIGGIVIYDLGENPAQKASPIAATIKEMVDRFLAWPLPSTVCADLCATNSSYQFPRSGTNLLNGVEAEAMIRHVIGDAVSQTPSDDAMAISDAMRMGEDGRLPPRDLNPSAQPVGEREPVAVIDSTWQLLWVGTEPIASIVEKHGLKIGDLLYVAKDKP